MSLEGRVGVVTGAGRGIGRQIATALAAEGMSLLLLARTGAQVRATAEQIAEHGGTALPAAVDITDAAAVDRAVLHAEQHLGPIDLLVNNAGVIEHESMPFWKANLDDMWRVVHTNLRGPMVMTRALLPAMIERGRGHIVTVTSRARAASQTGTYTGYAVSKRAGSILTDSLAAALAGTGVVAVDVLPGLVRTEMTESMPVWAGRSEWDDPALTARLVVEIAEGRYDAHAGAVLDATAI
jgi:3-oxoacyl-[acyl-carrier protein] reductase